MLPHKVARIISVKHAALAHTLNQMNENIEALAAMPGANQEMVVSSIGTAIKAVRQALEGSGVTFEGEYDPTRSYEPMSIVKISGGGASSGSYISVRAVPVGQAPSYPDVGIYWTNLGRTSDVSFFV